LADSAFRNERLHLNRPPGSGDYRTAAQRDRDRLLYSSAFRRLAEVTQVVSPTAGYVFHNRLTHSQQVAQVGRRLAEKLSRVYSAQLQQSEPIDPDVVESAGLAHDLGHPPFGHIAEDQLNELSKDIGGFEGNAQSFRIVTKLALHSINHRGLDLTHATLAATLKYPWFRGANEDKAHKWGAYKSEMRDFNFATALLPDAGVRTIEAELMDWADDVTYSVHDLEDFYRAGRMPLHLLARINDARERESFFENAFQRREHIEDFKKRRSDLQEAFTNVIVSNFPLEDAYTGTIEQRAGLRVFTSNLIARYINAVKLGFVGSSCRVEIDTGLKDEVTMLKELVWTYVIEAPALASQQYGQRTIISALFGIFFDAAVSHSRQKIFPAYYRERLEQAEDDDTEKRRICIDLLAGMTETQAINVYHRLTGSVLGSALEDILV
jgi:dGTPase